MYIDGLSQFLTRDGTRRTAPVPPAQKGDDRGFPSRSTGSSPPCRRRIARPRRCRRTDRHRPRGRQRRHDEAGRAEGRSSTPWRLGRASHFTHLFQIKTPGNNGGACFTVSLSRNGSGERLRFVPDSSKNNAEIGSVDLNQIRDKWVTVDMTFLMSKN